VGEPAIPTPAERASTLRRAREIINAVRNDEPWPEALQVIYLASKRVSLGETVLGDAIFQIAQLLDAVVVAYADQSDTPEETLLNGLGESDFQHGVQ
jgi:hypothetical protein